MNWDEFIVLCPQSIAKTNLLGRIGFVGSGNKSNTARDIEGERPSLALSDSFKLINIVEKFFRLS